MKPPPRRGALGGVAPRGGPGGREGSSISAGERGRMAPSAKGGGSCLEGGKVLKMRSRYRRSRSRAASQIIASTLM